VKSYDKSITALINAHESSIASLALNSDGSLLASASDKVSEYILIIQGTLIRIFKVEDGSFLQELRRGTEKADIYSIAFDPLSKFVACSSDRGTIHIFSLSTTQKKLKENSVKEENVEVVKESEEVEPKNQKSLYEL